jgi:hypothetical protein
MKKLKLKIALKIVKFGIWLYDANIDMAWDNEDRSNVKKLWEMHDDFERKLNGVSSVR